LTGQGKEEKGMVGQKKKEKKSEKTKEKKKSLRGERGASTSRRGRRDGPSAEDKLPMPHGGYGGKKKAKQGVQNQTTGKKRPESREG